MAYIILIIIYISIFIISKKMNDKVCEISENCKRIKDLNSLYQFKNYKKKMTIYYSTKSKKSLEKLDLNELIIYYFENNIDNFKNNFENIIYNKKLYEEYEEKYNEIDYETPIEEIALSKIPVRQFEKIEDKMIERLMVKNKFDFKVDVIATYVSPKGNNSYSKNARFIYDNVLWCYNEWNKKRSYKISSKIERLKMSDSLRYDVFKRDGFRCQICGATQRDGAKLHVDHIIPISKGGKTEMSNLQTLCDRCNLGKSNK